MEESSISKLDDQQIEELCLTAEETSREHILAEVSSKRMKEPVVSVETEGTKTIMLTADVAISPSPLMKSFSTQELVDEAVRASFTVAESYLREWKCQSIE